MMQFMVKIYLTGGNHVSCVLPFDDVETAEREVEVMLRGRGKITIPGKGPNRFFLVEKCAVVLVEVMEYDGGRRKAEFAKSEGKR